MGEWCEPVEKGRGTKSDRSGAAKTVRSHYKTTVTFLPKSSEERKRHIVEELEQVYLLVLKMFHKVRMCLEKLARNMLHAIN